MGPREEHLRLACSFPGWQDILVRLTIEELDIVQDVAEQMTGQSFMIPKTLKHMSELGILPDVLTEAICLAEHLDQEAEARSAPCPSCGEPNDPENDCELFGCNKCGKIICENCASSGMCESCDGKHNGTITVRFSK